MEQDYQITRTEEYKKYISALCRLASDYVSCIRVQFAEKAYDMYQNETIRQIVFAYADEIERLDRDRLRDFWYVSEHGATTSESLNDSCMNKAKSYGDTIKLLFGI